MRNVFFRMKELDVEQKASYYMELQKRLLREFTNGL